MPKINEVLCTFTTGIAGVCLSLVAANTCRAQGYDPIGNVLHSEAAVGSAYMANGQNLMPQGAPFQQQMYQLPPATPAPAPARAPTPYGYAAPTYGYGSGNGPVHLYGANNIGSIVPPAPPIQHTMPVQQYTYHPQITGFAPPPARRR